MYAGIEQRRAELAALCRRFGVARLEVFGSAARGTDFDPARSDADFLVTFDPDMRPDLASFLAFKEALESLFGRSVDLVSDKAIENPYIRASIDRSRELVYGA